MAKPSTPIKVETLKHQDATRKNIPTAEYQSVMQKEQASPIQVAYERRNKDLDPQLVWRGKDIKDWSDLVVQAPPLYIQEKVHPKVLIDDLLKRTSDAKAAKSAADSGFQPDLFGDFNGVPEGADKTDFYHHDAHWTNRMILGDSLQVMASLAEREGLRGKVQCIYFDPPYGIKFNSNFQWSTTSNKVLDGKADHITREPEQVKAFRDTWRDGIHSYLTYLRDRLTVARDLLTDSGSIFVQIGDENIHRVRALLEEIFGDENFVALIPFTKGAAGLSASNQISARLDYIIWFARSASNLKYRQLYSEKESGGGSWVEFPDTTRVRRSEIDMNDEALLEGSRLLDDVDLSKPGPGAKYDVTYNGRTYTSGNRWWGTPKESMERLIQSGKVMAVGQRLRLAKYVDDFPYQQIDNLWSGFGGQKNPVYVVQTNVQIVQRCLLMTSDPGDLVLDPTCGSGTSAFVAEQWGRRWITIDTSRVALALARARIMGARYPFFLLSDSREGQEREAEVTRTAQSTQPVHGNLRHGFVYERVPHITLKSIANNAEINIIWDRWQAKLESLHQKLNALLKKTWQDWEIPRDSESKWPENAKQIHADWWQARSTRQREIDASIAAKAESEYLYH